MWGADKVLVFEPLTGLIVTWRNVFDSRVQFAGNEYAVGDVNGDGLADLISGLVITNPASGSVSVESGGQLLLHRAPGNVTNKQRRDSTTDFGVFSGQPSRTIHLLGSRVGHGCTFVPQLGICIDLDQHIYNIASVVTDADGFADFRVTIPRRMPVGPVWVQALDINDPTRGPITSNVMELEIIAP